MTDFILTQTAQELQDILTNISGSIASNISFTPDQNIISTNVQTAITELSGKSVKHSLAIAENDVLVGAPTPFGSWIKKTISEFKTILGLGSAAYTASTAYDIAGAAAGMIATSISDGDLTHAPDGNSVFDALAAKADLVSPSFTTPILGTPTSGNLSNCTSATDTSKGVVELATDDEAITGASTSLVITPANLAPAMLTPSYGVNSLPYGVKWTTNTSTPVLTKGVILNNAFIPVPYSIYPIQSQMKRCVKNAAGTKLYDLLSTNSIYKATETTPLRSGTATSTSAGKLVDTAANFTTAGVQIGHWVHNTTSNIATQVTAVDSATQLSVKLDIFTSGNAYSVGTANPQVDGTVMVEVPATHYIMCTDGNYKYFLIKNSQFTFTKSDTTVVTSTLHPWFTEGGTNRSYQYWGAFESVWYDADGGGYKNHDGSTITAAGDKAVSMPGYQPLTYQTRPEMRSLHSNLGSSYHTESYYADEFMSLLFITEYATMNSQIALPGYTGGVWDYGNTRTTGRTMHLGNVSGTIPGVSGFDPGTYNIANSYRGIENCYGHVYKWLDGINFSNRLIYINNNPATWAEATATNYTNTGLSLPTDGVQMNFHSGLMLPSAIGADYATYVTDFMYSAAGWMALFSGGDLNCGAAAGVFYRDANNAGSIRYAGIGSRSAAV